MLGLYGSKAERIVRDKVPCETLGVKRPIDSVSPTG